MVSSSITTNIARRSITTNIARRLSKSFVQRRQGSSSSIIINRGVSSYVNNSSNQNHVVTRSNPMRISMQPQQHQVQVQRRNMVMVTQTKSSELPIAEEPEDSAAATAEDDVVVYTQSDILNVTPSCLNRVERLVRQRQSKEETDENFFLRVYVDAGGCSGFTYQFEIDSEMDEEEDMVIISKQQQQQNNSNSSSDAASLPRVVVDENSLEFMKGSTLDYVQEMIRSAFEIKENPQSESACGCGSSFALKNFAANPALD